MKRTITGCLILMLVIGLASALSFAEEKSGFDDVGTSDWFAQDVSYVCDNTLMKGTGDSRFSPGLPLTRGMLVTVLHRIDGEVPEGRSAFNDVKGDEWYAAPVDWACAHEVVKGFEDGSFRPNGNITREQLAVILYRYYQYREGTDGGAGSPAEEGLNEFDDAGEISPWARPAVEWAVGKDLLKGSGGKLDPRGSATRAQIAAVLSRFCRNVLEGFEIHHGSPAADGSYEWIINDYAKTAKFHYTGVMPDFWGRWEPRYPWADLDVTGITTLIFDEGITEDSDGTSSFTGAESVWLPSTFEGMGSCRYAEYHLDPGNPVLMMKGDSVYSRDGSELAAVPTGRSGEYTVDDGTAIIRPYAFSGCSELTGVLLPETLREIGGAAFMDCVSLKEIRVPGSVEKMGTNVFSGCLSLEKAEMDCRVEELPSWTFHHCSGLKEVKLSETIRKLDGLSFCGCPALEDLSQILSGIEEIEDRAFVECSGLKKVGIPEGVKTIGEHAFDDCPGLQELSVPASVEDLDSGRIAQKCPALRTLTIHPDNPAYASVRNAIFSKDLKTLYFCPQGVSGTFTVPGETEQIGHCAFEWCEKLTEISTGNGVREIGNFAFAACSGLKTLRFGSSAEEVFEEAYSYMISGDSSLKNIFVDPGNSRYGDEDGVLYDKEDRILILFPPGRGGVYHVPEGTKALGYESFHQCSRLTEVFVPEGVESVEGAFDECQGLKVLHLPKSLENLYECLSGSRAVTDIYFAGSEARWQVLTKHYTPAIEVLTPTIHFGE